MQNTSNTKLETYVSVNDLIESAVRKCGVTEGSITPSIIRIAKQNLFWALQELSLRGTPLWGIDTIPVGLNLNQYYYEMPKYITDILYCNRRQTNMLGYQCSGGIDPDYLVDKDYYTYATTTDSFIAQLGTNDGDAQLVGTVGLFFYGNQVNSITIDHSLDKTNWTTVYQESSPTMHSDGTWIRFDLSPQVNTTYVRVSVANGQQLSLRCLYLANLTNAVEIPMARMNRDTYGSYVNKNMRGIPTSWFYDKQIEPVVFIWQEPNEVFDTHLVIKRKTVVNDVGLLTQELELPSWYQEGVVWQLAARLCLELPRDIVDAGRYPIISQTAEDKINLAMNAETDGNPISLIPNHSCYTRR